MPRENPHQILLIAGDYDVIQQVQQALPGSRFLVQNAFNHREALYALDHGRFDAVLIDAAMSDRYSSARTIETLVQKGIRTPIVAFANNGDALSLAKRLPDTVTTNLEQKSILNSVMEALEISPSDSTMTVPTVKPAADDVLTRRTNEISTLFALSKSLTEVLDLSEVLNRVVEAARHLTNAEEGMILLPGDNDELYLRARVGIDVDTARNFRIKTRDTLAGEVFRTGQPTLVGASGPQKVKTEYFVNSLLYVPILLQGKAIGVLGVNNKNKEDLFDVHQQQLLMNLGSFAAIAMENARIHQESLDHARELQMLVAASQVMNSSLSMEETLLNICQQLANILKIGYSEIYLWEAELNILYARARYYRSMWKLWHGPALELSRHPMLKGALDTDRHRWLTHDDNVVASHELHSLEEFGAEAMLMIPIRSDRQILGAVRAFYVKAPSEIPQTEIMRRARNLGLESIVNLLNQTDTTRPSDVTHLAAKINQIAASDWCELSLLGKGSNALSVQTRIGTGIWLEPPYSTIDLNQTPDLLQALQSQSLVIPPSDGKITPAMKALMDHSFSRSVLGIPLVQRGKVRGLVVLGDTERARIFREREIDMARAMVSQAATAMDNAGLVRDLESSLEELKDTQERLVQTARLSAMGELAAVVAHQINNPLTTIIVDTELMLLDEEPGSKNHSALTAIHRAGKRAANVARRLLAIARPTDPNAVPEMIDVVDTVKGILSLMQTHIERSSIRIVSNLPEEQLPPIMAVKGQLDDIWLNLLMNAHDALVGWDDGRIGIEVYYVPERKSINVVVWDNGPGIPENIRTQIFSPFFTTKPVGEGTGLGLHICKEVVENVGGSIHVESVPGHHTSFIVRLPVSTPSE